MPRHTRNDLVVPLPTGLDDSRITATLALLDAIGMDHEVLVDYAIAQGANLNVRAHWPHAPNHEPMSVLARGVWNTCWRLGADEQAQQRTPWGDNGDQVLARLLTAGARDFEALRTFMGDPWIYANDGDRLDIPVVRAVETASLDALLDERRGSAQFHLTEKEDGQNILRSVLPKVFGKPCESWLVIAARHQRLDVIQHWFAKGGAYTHPGLGVFRAPLVAAFEPFVKGQASNSEVVSVLTEAWQATPDALYRQEALHLMVALASWRASGQQPWKAGPAGKSVKGPSAPWAKRVQQVEDALIAAMQVRPIDLRLTNQETEWVDGQQHLDAVSETLMRLEGAVLAHAAGHQPAEAARARSRL